MNSIDSRKKLTIAISGKSGCGNTTLSKKLSEHLGLEFINYTLRNLAEEEGMSFEELWNQSQSDYKWDRLLDKRQKEKASKGNCVIGSRLAIWILPEADLKIFLEAPLDVRAKRIAQREKKNLQEVIEFTKRRDQADHERYMSIYDIDNDEYDFADLVLDASLSIEELIEHISVTIESVNEGTLEDRRKKTHN